MNRSLPALVLLAASGCSTNLAMMQTAKTLDQGHFRVTADTGVYVPLGTTVEVITRGAELTKRSADAAAAGKKLVLTEEEEEAGLTAALALAVFPPSPLFDLSVRYGVIENLEVGLAYRTNAVRGDVKYRLLHSGGKDDPDASTDLAIDVGVSKYLFKNPVTDFLDKIKLGDFSRFDVDGSVLISRDFVKYFGVYGGARYVFSRTTMDQTLVRVSEIAGAFTETDVAVPARVDGHFIGATGGLRAGVPQFSVLLELTVGYTIASASILGKTRPLGGVTLYPALGLSVAL